MYYAFNLLRNVNIDSFILGWCQYFIPAETKAEMPPYNQLIMVKLTWLCTCNQVCLCAISSFQLSASHQPRWLSSCVLPLIPRKPREEFKGSQTWLCLRTMWGSIKKILMVHGSHSRLKQSEPLGTRPGPSWVDQHECNFHGMEGGRHSADLYTWSCF